jgi:hypothetical protein
VRQPWADAIMLGHKPAENRTWKPPADAIGTWIAIHASAAAPDELTVRDVRGLCPQRSPLQRRDEWDCGALLGIVRLVGVVEDHWSPWFSGPFGWVLSHPVRLRRPIDCAGRLNLWRVPDPARRALEALARKV